MKKLSVKNLPYILIFVSAIALLLRGTLSFCWSDESFYFSTSNRFLMGDSIFVDEWFPTQLVSIILLPFHLLYKTIVGSNDGVLLYFRSVYVVVSALAAILIYRIIEKKRGAFTGMAAALFYQYYSHLNIATMNYYMLSYTFFLISMLLIYDYISDKPVKSKLIAAGAIFALSVLSLPTLAAVYFPAAFLLWLIPLWKKELQRLWWDILKWTFVGILIPAVPVLIYTAMTSGVMGIIDNLQYVLSDEEHVQSLGYPFRNFFLSVYAVFNKKMVLSAVLLAVIGFIVSIKAVAVKIEAFFPAVLLKSSYLLIDFVLFLYFLSRAIGHTGYIATALLLFALPLFTVRDNRDRDYAVFVLLFVGGLVFSMVYSYSSMCDLYVLSIGHNVAAIAGICLVRDYITELKGLSAHVLKERMLSMGATICYVVIFIVLIQTMTLRFVNVYRDAPVLQLTTKIDQGPAKGLYTTDEHYEAYSGVLSMLQESDRGEGYIFISKLLPWGYLAADMQCGALTTWRTKLSSERLARYYEVHPEKVPEVVVILNASVGAYDTCGDVEADPFPNENEETGKLYELISSDKYTMQEYPYGRVYQRR